MERHWPQLVLNKKFAPMSERKLPSNIHLGLILLWSVRARVPLSLPRVAGSLAAKIPLQDGLVIGKPSRPTEKYILNYIFVSVESQGDNRSRVYNINHSHNWWQPCKPLAMANKSGVLSKTVPEFNSFLYRPRLLTREVQMTKLGHCRCFLGARTRIRSV